MKERPILFSSPMVKAILEGKKTQTRRVLKKQPNTETIGFDQLTFQKETNRWNGYVKDEDGGTSWNAELRLCPFGQVGDRLWVRETWAWCSKNKGHYIYKADGDGFSTCHVKDYKWKPSIHMPRKASRITLGITNIKVERLQEISSIDCHNEGADEALAGKSFPLKEQRLTVIQHGFAWLWDQINGKKYPWESNPWVWVIEFKVLEAKS